MEENPAVENESETESNADAAYDLTLIAQHLLNKYGPLIGPDSLWQILNFNSRHALETSIYRGRTRIPVITQPGRSGKYILATDLANYLVNMPRPLLAGHRTEVGKDITNSSPEMAGVKGSKEKTTVTFKA